MNTKHFVIPGTGWVKTNSLHLFNLLRVIFRHYPIDAKKYFLIQFLTGTFIYPAVLIVSKDRAKKLVRKIINRTLSAGIVLPLPFPLVGKVQIQEIESGYANLYADDEYRRDMLSKGMVVVDAGAYIGLYTCMAAAIAGDSGKILAFEPDPVNHRQLLNNVKLNGYKNVTIVQCALAETPGKAKLYMKHHGTVSSLVGDGKCVDVDLDTLDNVVARMGMARVDLIKIDVEGFELPVLRGAEKTIKENPEIKMVIASYHYPTEVSEVSSYLAERGFNIEVNPEGILFATPGTTRKYNYAAI